MPLGFVVTRMRASSGARGRDVAVCGGETRQRRERRCARVASAANVSRACEVWRGGASGSAPQPESEVRCVRQCVAMRVIQCLPVPSAGGGTPQRRDPSADSTLVLLFALCSYSSSCRLLAIIRAVCATASIAVPPHPATARPRTATGARHRHPPQCRVCADRTVGRLVGRALTSSHKRRGQGHRTTLTPHVSLWLCRTAAPRTNIGSRRPPAPPRPPPRRPRGVNAGGCVI